MWAFVVGLVFSLAALAPSAEVTNLNDSGPGSLRNACGGKNVTFSPALAGKTITLASRIDLRGDVVIDATAAPGVIISGGGKTRLFFVPMKAKATFAGLTCIEAVNIDTDKSKGVSPGGGAIYGEMWSEVTIVGCTFRGNKVQLHEGGGAAVWMSYHSKLLMSDCRVEDNVCEGGGERGGAVSLGTNATSVIRRSVFTGNKGFTGGINNCLASLTVEDCVFEKNEGNNVGGAIYTDGASEKPDDDLGGAITVTRCRFVGNSSKGLGGACYLFLYPPDRLLVQGSVFDGNSGGSHGGGFASGNGIMEVVDCAFLRNSALYGASIWTSGSKKQYAAPLTVRNTLFALNTSPKGTCGGVSTETTDLLTIDRCTFWKNTGGGGGAVQFWNKGSQGKIINSIFAENQSPIWSGGPAPTAEGVNIVWPSPDVFPKGDSVVKLDPQLEAVPQPEDKMPQVVPRASGLAGKVGASVVAESGKKGAIAKAKPEAAPKPVAAPRPGATALSKAIAAEADAPARDAAVAGLRAHLVGAGAGTSGPLPSFEHVVVQGGDERTVRFTTGAGKEQSLPWKLVDDLALLRLAQPGLGSAPAKVRADWVALACHLDLSRVEVRKELEPLRAADPERFAMFVEVLTSAEATPAQ